MRNQLSTTNRQKYYPATNSTLNNHLVLTQEQQGTNALVASIFHEQCRSILAKTALDNLGALSAFEEHLLSIAPGGEKQYRQIIEAFASGAAMKIWRW
jgi:hypothetical protein